MKSIVEILTSWVGWYSGTLLLGNPCDLASFRKWSSISLSTVYFIAINGINLAYLYFDYAKLSYSYSYSNAVNESGSGRKYVLEYVTKTLMTLKMFLNALIQISFIYSATRISKFILKLRQRVSASRRNLPIELNYFEHCIIWISLLVNISSAAVWTVSLTRAGNDGISDPYDFSGWIPNQNQAGYAVLFYIFISLPSDIEGFIAFTFIFMTTIYVQTAFDQFCDDFQREINKINNPSTSNTNRNDEVYYEMQSENPAGVFLLLNELKLSWMEPSRIKQKLLGQIDYIFETFRFYDEINGPLLLGLISESCVTLVQILDNMVVHELTLMDKCLEWVHFAVHVLQLYLLQVGFSFQRNVSNKVYSLKFKLE